MKILLAIIKGILLIALIIGYTYAIQLSTSINKEQEFRTELVESKNEVKKYQSMYDNIQEENTRLLQIIEAEDLRTSEDYRQQISDLETQIMMLEAALDEANMSEKSSGQSEIEISTPVTGSETENNSSETTNDNSNVKIGYYSETINAEGLKLTNLINAISKLDGTRLDHRVSISINSIIGPYKHSNGYYSIDGNYAAGLDNLGDAIFQATLHADLHVNNYGRNKETGKVDISENTDLSIKNSKDKDLILHVAYSNNVVEAYFTEVE